MEGAQSWIAAWQSVVPVGAAVLAILLMKWFSRHSEVSTARRTARVLAKLDEPGGRS